MSFLLLKERGIRTKFAILEPNFRSSVSFVHIWSTLVTGSGIKQDMLNENEIFLLVDNQKVYSWKGRKSSKSARKQLTVNFDDFMGKIRFKGNPSVEMLNQVKFYLGRFWFQKRL